MRATLDPVSGNNEQYRVLRGGSCYYEWQPCRSASRSMYSPDTQYQDFGFRVISDPVSGSETKYKSLRGGSWINVWRICRSAIRGRNSPGTRDQDFGFRVISDPVSLDQGTTSHLSRVLRGGSWDNFGQRCRSAISNMDSPEYHDDNVGFRALSDPVNEGESQTKVIRGGGGFIEGRYCRSARRDWSEPDLHFQNFSFRVTATGECAMYNNMDDFIHGTSDDPMAWAAYWDHQQEEGRDFELPSFTNSIGMKMILVPPGVFQMGSPPDEEGRDSDEQQHWVYISKAFYMSATQVTQAQWQEVMGNNPSWFCKTGGGRDKVKGMDTSEFPVEQVSWNDTQEFLKKLSEKEGMNYHLPSEAQWEYACRANSPEYQVFHYGNTLSSHQANFNGNYPYGGVSKGPYMERTCKVGSYEPNAWGFYDMHGNVWEWCQDWYNKDYYQQCETEARELTPDEIRNINLVWQIVELPQTEDAVQASVVLAGVCEDETEYKSLRGGSWNYDWQFCRSANRNRVSPGTRSQHIAFRVISDPVLCISTNPSCEDETEYKSLRGGSCYNVGRHCRSADRFRYEPEIQFQIYGIRVVSDPVSGSETEYKSLRGGSWINVWRICRSANRCRSSPDMRSQHYAFRVISDPVNEGESETKVMRGSSWRYLGPYCRSAHRNWYSPDVRINLLGFRATADPVSQQESSPLYKVMRSGSWTNLGRNCRSAYRFWNGPDERFRFYGFRLAAVPM